MENIGITNVHEMDWWDSFKVGEVEFVFTPSQHWSARGIADRNQTLWGSWAVFGADFHWYFTGDTGYSHDFIDIQNRFPALSNTRRKSKDCVEEANTEVIDHTESIHRDTAYRTVVTLYDVFAATFKRADESSSNFLCAVNIESKRKPTTCKKDSKQFKCKNHLDILA